jgi:hypothetical protein
VAAAAVHCKLSEVNFLPLSVGCHLRALLLLNVCLALLRPVPVAGTPTTGTAELQLAVPLRGARATAEFPKRPKNRSMAIGGRHGHALRAPVSHH